MKKKVVLILLIVLISLILGFFIYIPFSLNNTLVLNSTVIVDEDNNTIQINKDNDLRILQLTDIQINNFISAAYSFDIAKATITRSNPDIIVLTGDNLNDNANEEHLIKLVEFMDSFHLPWAVVYGNHDYNTNINMSRQNEIYEKSHYCLFKTGDVADYNGNYYYNIKRDNEVVYQLIFMDSKTSGFSNDGINWYTEVVTTTTNTYNKIIPSMMFFHIPINELKLAYDAYQKDSSIGYGSKNEEMCVQDENDIYKKIKELKSTKALVYGHDHINSLIINYEDIMFCYGLKSGRTSDYLRHMMGGNVFILDKDNNLNIERIYV